MPVKIPTVQTGLEASIQAAAKKAGRNLKINMGGNAKSIEGLSQPLGRITGKADQFTKSMEAANARVLAFGASVGILAAVTRGFKELVLTTIEVEKSLVSINSILGTNAKELEGFSKTIFNVARDTEQSFNTVANAALELSRQGLNATEVQKRLADSMILTRVSGLGATEAVSGLTAAINSFNKAGLSSSVILNKLSAAAVSAAVSERDLIEGIKRAGSVASLAGVSFDELVGVITAVQVKTARGGAVIGNSFKTIFTRIQSIDKLETMQSLGVQVTDTSGKVLGATKIIQNLSKVLGELPEAKRLQIAEGLVGKFQISPFLALLDDYNDKTSKAINITKVSQNATTEAYDRNVALNQTLSTAINKATISLKELGDTLGKIGVTDNLKNLLGFFNTLVESVKGKLDGEGAGGDFARGIVKGIGAVISGPGLAIFGAIIIKLGIDLAKFGLGSLKTFFGLNQAAREQAALQGQIASTLLGNKSIQEKILSIENSSLSAEKKKVEQTKFFTTAIKEQLAVMRKMQGIAIKVAPGVRNATKGGRAAGGFIPNYNAIAGYGSESSDISKGVGGAPTSAKPVTIPNFNFGGGQKGTMVANSSEYVVPNYAGSGGSAIFNQDMVSSMGMPAGARKISAAGGYIPNFAKDQTKLVDFAGMIVPKKGLGSKTFATGKFGADTFKFPVYGIDSAGEKTREEKELKSRIGKYAINLSKSEAKSMTGGDPTSGKINKLANQGAIGSLAGAVFETALSALLNSPDFDFGETGTFDYVGNKAIKNISEISPSLRGSKINYLEAKIGSNYKTNNSMAKKIVSFFGKNPTGKKVTSKALQQLTTGADKAKGGLSGASAVRSNLGISNKGRTPSARGYIPNFANPLQDAIGREQDAGLPVNQIRVNQSPKLRNAGNPMGLAVTNTRDEPTGAIPNFARRSEELGYGKNASSAVRRQGNFGQFDKSTIQAQKNYTKSLKDSTGQNNNNIKGQRDMLGGIFATQIAFSALSGATSDAEKGFGRVANRLTTMGGSITTAVFAGSAITSFGESMEGMGGKVVKSLGQIGTAIGIAAAVYKGLTKLYEDATGITDSNNLALAKLADAADKAAVKLSSLGEEDKRGIKKQREAILADVFNRTGEGKAVNAKAPEGVKSIELPLLASLAKSIDEGLSAGIDADTIKSIIRESAVGGGTDLRVKGSAAQEFLRKDAFGKAIIDGAAPREVDRLDQDERNKVIDSISALRAGTQDVSKTFEKLNKKQLESLISFGRRKKIVAEEGGGASRIAAINRKGDIDEFRKGMAAENITIRKTQDSLLEQEAEKAPAKLKAIEQKEADDALKVNRVAASIEKQRIQLAVDLAKADRTVLDQMDQRILKAQLAKSLTEDEMIALKTEQSILNANFNLRNNTLDAVANMAKLSKELTFKEKASQELQDLIAESAKKTNFTIKEREALVENLNRLLAESDQSIQDALRKQLDSVSTEEKKTDQLIKQEKVLGKIKVTASEINQIRKASDLGAIGNIQSDNFNKNQTLEKAIKSRELDAIIRSRGSQTTLQQESLAKQAANDTLLTAQDTAQKARNTLEEAQSLSAITKINAIGKGNLDKLLKNNIDLQPMMDTGEINSLGFTPSGRKPEPSAQDLVGQKGILGALDLAIGSLDSDIVQQAELKNFKEELIQASAALDDQSGAAILNAKANLKSAGFFEKISSQLSEDMATQLRRGGIQGQFDTDRISDPVARLKAQISEDSREARANAAQDPAETRRILRSDEAKFRDIDDKMTIDPTERIKNRINEDSRAARDSALDLDNQDFKEFRRLVEEDQFSGKLVDASAQFAHNIGDAMTEAIIQGGNLGDILIGTATSFFTTLSKAYMTRAVDSVIGKFASGGKVTGGSGNRDDVPALLTGGEFVMKKSSVSKYGSSFMESLNAGSIPAMARGGLFTPGTNGQEEIKGKSNLIDFATQSFTTGASDRFGSGAGSASVNLEPQSAALTMFGRRNSPAFQREQDSKRDAFGLFTQQVQKEEEAREQKKEAKKALKNAIFGAVVSAGFSALETKFSKPKKISTLSESLTNTTEIQGLMDSLEAYKKDSVMFNNSVPDSMLSRSFATGGSVPNTAGVDTVPSMLSGGEFVMNAAATQKIGAGNLNALNSGAGGGSEDIVSKLDELISVSDNAGETVINITVNSDGSSDTQGGGGDGGGEQQRSLATRIKDVVKQVIDDEKRLGGSLRQARA